MRISALYLLAAIPAFALPARAQVTTNDQALDALKPAAPAAPARPDAARPSARKPAHKISRPAHAAPAPTPPPQVPNAAPANAVMAPAPFVMPAHPRPNPPPVPVKPDAAGEATPIDGGGTRITFGAGVATLNQATHDAIIAIAAQAKANPALTISVTAWAPGTPDDPSPARTLALERALAARAVLINAGVVSDRILAISRGFDGIAGGPPERLDMTLAAPKQTPAGTPLSPPAAPAAVGKTKPKP